MAKAARMTERQLCNLNYYVARTGNGSVDAAFLRRAYWKLYEETVACRKEIAKFRRLEKLDDSQK